MFPNARQTYTWSYNNNKHTAEVIALTFKIISFLSISSWLTFAGADDEATSTFCDVAEV